MIASLTRRFDRSGSPELLDRPAGGGVRPRVHEDDPTDRDPVVQHLEDRRGRGAQLVTDPQQRDLLDRRMIQFGLQPHDYQWYRDGVAVSGATSSSYTTAAAVAGDDGADFTVAVGDTFGTEVTSDAARLAVIAGAGAATTALSPPPMCWGNWLTPVRSDGT